MKPFYKIKVLFNESNCNYEYHFESIGPKGCVKKVAYFFNSKHKIFYNFCFGDLDEVTGKIIENKVTNNKDTFKVLLSIEWIIRDFVKRFPERWVRVTCNDDVRLRFFTMWVSRRWKTIEKEGVVFGLKYGEWQNFSPNTKYDVLLFKSK